MLRGRSLHRQIRRAQTTALLLNPRPNDVILDVGCGDGFITSHFHNASFVVGVDLSWSLLLLARRKVKHSHINFVCADAANLPFRDSCFDKVTMLELLEHVPRETQERICHEVDRVLKKKGVLVISVPYKEKITYVRCNGKLVPRWGHLWSMDEDKVTALLPRQSYTLTTKYHLPNVELLSVAIIFKHLPLRYWLLLNNMLGRLRKGYWILLKYVKNTKGKRLLKLAKRKGPY